MKRKILIGILISVSIIQVGCSNNTLKDSKTDSIVIDEDTKKTTNNSEIEVQLVSRIEYLKSSFEALTIMQENPIHLTYYIDSEDKLSENPRYKLYTLNIGTISNKKDHKNYFNIIDWEDDKDIEGQVLLGGIITDEVRIYKDEKVYKFKENGDLQEIKAYEKLVREHGENLRDFMVQGDGSIDLWYLEEDLNKCYLIDNEKDKFYEIDKTKINGLKDKYFSVVTIEDNKIYIVLSNNEHSDPITIGYIENNTFYELISKDKGISVVNSSNRINMNNITIYNNKILFTGLQEGNGIWSYNIEKGELKKELHIEENRTIEFFLSKDKKKIIIQTFNTNQDHKDDEDNYSISIGNINENLEISNLTNVVSGKSNLTYRGFIRWSKDSSKFYLFNEDAEKREKSFEVYRIKD